MAEGPDEVTRRDPQGAPESTPAASEELKERAGRGDEVAAARAEVEQARAEMGETIDAIQERLDPERLKERAKAQASTTALGTGSELLETIKSNPAPVAIAGGVIGLLLVRRLLRGRGRDTVVIDLRTGRIR